MNTKQKNNRSVSVRARKSLGQHFLTSQKVVNTIVTEAKLTPDDTVLEIGPGTGTLTKMLLEKAGKVIAIEKDASLVKILQEKFENEITTNNLHLICDDILSIDIKKLGLNDQRFKVVANIPYYITGEFLRKILSCLIQPSSMTLLVQKEVAKRIVAHDGKESILSLSIKVYGEPKYIKTVAARYFKPKPKVDSAILLIENISKDFFINCSEDRFFTLVKRGFAHKRKKLIRNLESVLNNNDIKNTFISCDILTNTRAEDVPLEKWKCLCKK